MKITKEQYLVIDKFNQAHSVIRYHREQLEALNQLIRDMLNTFTLKKINLPCLKCKEISFIREWNENNYYCSDCGGSHISLECPKCSEKIFISKELIFLLQEEKKL